jgi:hypothetical protein
MTDPIAFIALDLTKRIPALQARDGTKLTNQAKRLEPAIAETVAALGAEGYEIRRKAPPPSRLGIGAASLNAGLGGKERPPSGEPTNAGGPTTKPSPK